MLISKLFRPGLLVATQLSTGKCMSFTRTGFLQRPPTPILQPLLERQTKATVFQGALFQKYHHFSCTSADDDGEEEQEYEVISVTFVEKNGKEKQVEVPIGMSILEAAHENDIDLEGACEGQLSCSTCHVIVTDVEYYNKLEDPSDEEYDMLSIALGVKKTSRLGCQLIASPELDGIRLAIPRIPGTFLL